MGEGKLEIFTEENVMLNASFKDKWEAIRACGGILVERGYVTAAYVDDMIRREQTASVYAGNHLAIPHGVADSEEHILASGISFVQIPDGVDFDGEKAYLMIGIAGKDGGHIEMLGNIALVCCEMEVIDALRVTQDKREVCRLLAEIKTQ